ncbi:MAG: VWA domain-containing protein [Planctomycetota bacterium]|jgi:Mg-chelatase subunit ChlD|nr:VWA domain-containing protein [Planctomycetota bacterium]
MKRCALVFLLTIFLPVCAVGETPKEKAERLDAYYKKTNSWAVQALVLLALVDVGHPDAVGTVEKAITGRNPRLLCYGVETLASMPEKVLRAGVSKGLLERLVKKEFKRNHKYFHARVGEILRKMTGKTFASPREAADWWRGAKKTWRPEPWKAPPVVEKASPTGEDESLVQKLIEKLFDLGKNGLEIVFVIDATGSMQPTLDAVRNSVDSLASVLGSIVPRFRMGLVIYRDLSDMQNGAKISVTLTQKTGKVKDALATEKASGGGDFEERVEKGLELALEKKNRMRWSPAAGKVLVVIGDAPPHATNLDRCVELVKNAHQKPFGIPRVIITGSKKKRLVPFITSTIQVGGAADTREAFEKISKAGGGTSTTLQSSADVLKGILLVSFGQEWEKEIGRFVNLFLKFRAEGLFK